ncbi:MAG: hypothetical protein L0177_11260 [Chloroflexi bacterium]|nr:hypothetical protein [Chloroflexota bacterium]
MIKDEHEYKVTKKTAQRLIEGVERMERGLDQLPDDEKVGRSHVIRFQRSMIADLESQMKEYEAQRRNGKSSSQTFLNWLLSKMPGRS